LFKYQTKRKTRTQRSCRIYDKINPRGCNDIHTSNKHQVPELHKYRYISRNWFIKNAELDVGGKILEIC
jgi:hypothetical protein